MNLRQVETWYGPPGSLAASQRGTDITPIGPSEERPPIGGLIHRARPKRRYRERPYCT